METIDIPADSGTRPESRVGTASLAHQIAGRIRLHVHSMRGDSDRAREIEGLLGGLEFVEQVTSNPRTGSVTVEYSTALATPSHALEQVAAALDIEIEEPRRARRGAVQLTADSSVLAERVRQ